MKQISCAALASLSASLTIAAQDLTLCTRGQPSDYVLVRPAKASPSQRYAAEEFQTFAERLTGVKLPILTDEGPLPAKAVLIGDTRHTALLLALGLTDFSMPPASLLQVRDTLLRCDRARLRSLAPRLLRAADRAAIERVLAKADA